ncbi:MAG: MFS transporter [Candidatus Eremiobacteraeota bacterium]|nr:MFS transporter [Candidatus Eremiobacteraeota bacterium]
MWGLCLRPQSKVGITTPRVSRFYYPKERLAVKKLASWVVALMIAVAFMGSGLITPLYELYQKAFQFSEITLTLIYAAYVVGNLVALLFLGKLSDRIGRRTISAAGVAVGFVSMVIFLFASSTASLYVGRVLSGIAVGLATGTGAAWLSDLNEDKSRATLIAAAANAFGFALGPIVAGALAQYTASPLRFPFYVYIPILILAGLLLVLTPETVKRHGAGVFWQLLRPQVGVPKELRADFVAPAITAFAVFAIVGYYAALIPSILAQTMHAGSPVVAGAIVFELAFVAGCSAIVARRLDSRTSMIIALFLVIPSVGGLLFAQLSHSMSALLATTALAGVCWALGYRGSLQVINELAPEDRRAEVASSYFIAGFIGNSIPVIGVGIISAAANPTVSSIVFGCTIGLFALIALGSEYPLHGHSLSGRT